MSKILKILPNEKLSENFLNIEPASKFIPDWYRNSNSQFAGSKTFLIPNNPSITTSTYKKCTPFYDAMTLGYIFYLTADIEVVKRSDGLPEILYRTTRQIVTKHTANQWDGLPVPQGYYPFVYKWHNQFGLKTPKGYSLLFINPSNRFDLPFMNVNGLVDTDKYDISVHFPFFVKLGFEGIIEKGTPIAQAIPVKNETWIREVEHIDKNDYHIRLDKYVSTIKRSYKNNFWKKKDYR